MDKQLKGFALLALLFLSATVFAHDVQLITQHVDLRKQAKVGWQSDLLAKATLSRKWEAGLQGTYLERFGLYEKRAGGLVIYRPWEGLSLELKYLQGQNVEILPERQWVLTTYYALTEGVSSFFTAKYNEYTVTKANMLTLGFEIEKWKNIILIPQVMYGKAAFSSPAETKDLYSVGLKAIYYEESKYSFSVFGYKGQEASQGIVGVSTIVTDTLTGGASAAYYVTPGLRAELVADHTDYHQLRNQFLTTTLNLHWTF